MVVFIQPLSTRLLKIKLFHSPTDTAPRFLLKLAIRARSRLAPGPYQPDYDSSFCYVRLKPNLALSARISFKEVVFEWLSKHRYQSNQSNQSQLEQTAWWINQNSSKLPITCSKCRKRARVQVASSFDFAFLIGWKTGTRFLSQSLSEAFVLA